MRNKEKDKRLARKLLDLSIDNGEVSGDCVDAVLERLRSFPAQRQGSVLKLYMRYVTREMARNTARVEYAGDVSDEALKQLEADFSSHYERPVTAVKEANPGLVAGVRIHVGDDVWDDSIHTHLQSFSPESKL